jgi:hypothetical protein
MTEVCKKQLPAIILRPSRPKSFLDATTYCRGPKLLVTKNITRKNFIQMCDLMGCEPEKQSFFGGFRYIFALKSIWLHLENSYVKGTQIPIDRSKRDQWPVVNEFIKNDWYKNDTILIHGDQEFDTTLMNAHAFTFAELRQWEAVFNRFGILCTNFPKLE